MRQAIRNGIGGGLAALFALSLLLTGCSGGSSGGGAAELPGEITATNFYDALYLIPSEMNQNSSIVDGFSIQSDPSAKEVRMDLRSYSSDAQVVAADVEDLVRKYDIAVIQACMNRAEDEGDDELVERWRAIYDEETAAFEAAEDATAASEKTTPYYGRIYNDYTLFIVVDDDDSTLDLDGFREAGPEGRILWQ